MTYSIVARDSEANQMGIAVQSHHLSVGAHVVAAEPGVGVLAVQSYADRSYATDAIASLRAGNNSDETLEQVLGSRFQSQQRAQVAVLAPQGRPSIHTGVLCVASCGHAASDSASAQANMVRSPHVWSSMLERFESANGDLASRLLDALDAGEEEGGDWRGRQSAAVVVVSMSPDDKARPVDLRVDDHHEPLVELRRLDGLRRAAAAMSDAFEVASSGNTKRAVEILDAAQEVYGSNLEPTAWSAVLLARAGVLDEARLRAARAIESEPGWGGLIAALPEASLLPDDPSLIDRLLDDGRSERI